MACYDKVEGFRQFCGKVHENLRMLTMIKDEYKEKQYDVKSKCVNSWRDFTYQGCPSPSDENGYTKSTGEGKLVERPKTADESNTKGFFKTEHSFQEDTNIKLPKDLTIKEEDASGVPEKLVEVIPDVTIVLKNTESLLDDRKVLEEPVSPPPSTEIKSVVNNFGVPILVPVIKHGPDYRNEDFNYYRGISSDERRKQRNREASRRYRERARENPELLKKMRNQQNARQKKYYARLRMKKMNAEEFFNGEDTNKTDSHFIFVKN